MRRAPGPIGVSLRNIRFTYPGATRPALVDFTLDVAPGTIVAVTGAVGSGKSTLARTLLGIYPIESGTVRLSRGLVFWRHWRCPHRQLVDARAKPHKR